MDAGYLKQHLAEFHAVYLAQVFFNGCFYGIRAIFVLYAIGQFALTEAEAISLFATFMILCYGTSLMGGYIADKGLGVKNTIIMGGALSSLGLLCTLSSSEDLYFLGLALASLGSGFFKPNIMTSLGLLFENPKDPGKDRAYSFLYIAMNLGSFIVPIICGVVGKAYGWRHGVVLVAALFAGATYFVYKTMRFHPAHREDFSLSKMGLAGSGVCLVVLLYFLFKYQGYFHSLMGFVICGSIVYLGTIFYHCNAQERKDVSLVILYVALFAVLCGLSEQAGMSMVLFYEKAVDRQVMGIEIPSSAFLSLDPLFTLLFSPILLFLSARYFEKTKPINGLVKVGMGFLCVAFGFGILALGTSGNNGLSVSPVWIVAATFVQVVGAFWVAPVSFSKISQYAPLRYKSALMSFWSMAIAYGHYLAGFLAQFSLKEAVSLPLGAPFGQYRSFFTYLALLAACVTLSLFVSRGLKCAITSMVRK